MKKIGIVLIILGLALIATKPFNWKDVTYHQWEEEGKDPSVD